MNARRVGPLAVAALVLLVPLVLLAACGGGSGSEPPSGSLPAVSVTRTGGIAGLSDEVVIAPDGAWTATGRAGGGSTGSLAEQDRTELARLATDPALAGEAAQSRPPTRCADTFNYTVTVGTLRVAFVDCPTDPPPPPVAAGIVRLVRRAVWA